MEAFLNEYHGYEVSNNLFLERDIIDKSVVEVGCGHGFISLLLANKCSFVTGYDVDKTAIEYAEKMRELFGVLNVQFIEYQGTIKSEETYDVAISMDVIEHVPNPIDYLKEINKIIKPSGFLLLGTPNGLIANKNKCIIQTHSKFHVTEFTPVELTEYLNESGFEVVNYFSNKNVSGGGYHITFVKRVVIVILCKLGLLDLISEFIGKLKGRNTGRGGREKNRVQDWQVSSMQLDSYNSRNCDVIIIKAIKKSVLV